MSYLDGDGLRARIVNTWLVMGCGPASSLSLSFSLSHSLTLSGNFVVNSWARGLRFCVWMIVGSWASLLCLFGTARCRCLRGLGREQPQRGLGFCACRTARVLFDLFLYARHGTRCTAVFVLEYKLFVVPIKSNISTQCFYLKLCLVRKKKRLVSCWFK